MLLCSSLRGISRISNLAYDTVVSIVRSSAQKAQMVHNHEVQNVDTDAIAADELWSFVEKNTHHCLPEELEAGDCWIAVRLAQPLWINSVYWNCSGIVDAIALFHVTLAPHSPDFTIQG